MKCCSVRFGKKNAVSHTKHVAKVRGSLQETVQPRGGIITFTAAQLARMELIDGRLAQ